MVQSKRHSWRWRKQCNKWPQCVSHFAEEGRSKQLSQGAAINVHDSAKNDTPYSKSMQTQRVLYSAEVQCAVVSPLSRQTSK